MTITISKKKIVFPVIAVVILLVLVSGVFYALTFIKDVFQGVAGGVDGVGGISEPFNLQGAKGLGIVIE